MCPHTCNMCVESCSTESSLEFEFFNEGGKVRRKTCAFVAENKDHRCQHAGVGETCRATCQIKVEISITTDQYPGETTWTLEKSNGEIVSTGGPYDENFKTYDTELCVETWNCYTFTINDSFGDGLFDGGSVVVKADDTDMLSTPAGGASFSSLDVDIGQCPTPL